MCGSRVVDRAMFQDRLAAAERHVSEAQRHVANQRERLSQLSKRAMTLVTPSGCWSSSRKYWPFTSPTATGCAKSWVSVGVADL
jgi:hypothetical protein